jgi:hypothetical protein
MQLQASNQTFSISKSAFDKISHGPEDIKVSEILP